MPTGVYDRTLENCPRMVNPDLSPSVTLSYVLGVLCGDGSVFKIGRGDYIVSLGVNDREFAEAFYESLRDIGLRPRIWYDKKRMRYQVIAYSKILYKWFKTKNLDDIQKLVSNNLERIHSFLKGFYDSEGSLIQSTKRYQKGGRHYQYPLKEVRLSNTNMNISQLVLRLLEKANFHPNLQHRIRDTSFSSGITEYKIILQRKSEIASFVSEIGSNIPRKVS